MTALPSGSSVRGTSGKIEGVRVRFCPSPTGNPHVGMIRTCLFNWAFARHHGGVFVFRIEDTDAARDSQDSYEQLLDSLRWLGMEWDEGPEVGGPHAPYRQSERRAIYLDVVQRLKAAGHLYESYSSPGDVEARHKAAGRDPKLGYDNYDRNLTPQQREEFRAQGRDPVLRLRMPDADLSWDDLVRGPVTFAAGSVPDFVVVRGNGEPLYTLVNPVDDALMEITHVLRGEDLLPSTPRQIALYAALMDIGVAQRVPEFGHLPYVMGEGNKKLSKRDPESSLLMYRQSGYLPEALLNYLALLGWSIGEDRDIFSLAEMAEAFDGRRVSVNPARFDPKKCESVNATHLRALSSDDFAHRLLGFMDAGSVDLGLSGWLGDERRALVMAAAPLVQERVQTLSEAELMLGFLLVRDDAFELNEKDAAKHLGSDAAPVLGAAVAALEAIPQWSLEAIETALRTALIEGLGLKPRVAFGPLRVAATGAAISPPLFESLQLLGSERALTRLRAAFGRAQSVG
jgi:glutamyl-tRNA synthetase